MIAPSHSELVVYLADKRRQSSRRTSSHHTANMSLLEAPTSFRIREFANTLLSLQSRSDSTQIPMSMAATVANSTLGIMANTTLSDSTLDITALTILNDHSSHPNFFHLAGLVSEAVLEVVFVALPGYLVARSGMFDASSQKFVAELNTMVFTPCLIFTKLASQLNADTLADLAVIPFIFVAQTLISFCAAQLMVRLFGFGKPHKQMQKNFVIAMGVFGNSNSLPISLVISLSKTISGLHWDQIPGDNDEEVGARGILYLLIFQQLGQLLRWTWGYSVLLKPKSAYEQKELEEQASEERIIEEGRYTDEPQETMNDEAIVQNKPNGKPTDSGFGSGSQTPMSEGSSRSTDSDDEDAPLLPAPSERPKRVTTLPANLHPPDRSAQGALQDRSRSTGHMTTFPNFSRSDSTNSTSAAPTWKTPFLRFAHRIHAVWARVLASLTTSASNAFRRLPSPLQKILATIYGYTASFFRGVWRQMNPPLWAMLAALIVASVPDLQRLFFTPGTLMNNSVTSAIKQSGGVAVPLILVVLGANLARSTLPRNQLANTASEIAEERRLLWASLLSRMVIPTLVMAPILALIAKYIPVSILDDPIFIIVCFLLTGAPSALQLAQICQINEVFMGAMSSLLVASYVFAIFPSTLVLVLLALEVVEWAT